MMRKQFKDIDIYAGIKAQDGAKWIKDNGIVENWKTPEHIEVRPVYTKEDLEVRSGHSPEWDQSQEQ